jgi:hypothetical protein
MTGPKNITAFEGTTARLTCHADGYPGNVTYRWFHYGPPSIEQNHHQPIWLPVSNNDDDTEDVDYVYTAENDDPDVDDDTTSVTAQQRRQVHLRRRRRRRRQQQQQQQQLQRSRLNIQDDGTLVIQSVSPDDRGWYSCRPTIDHRPHPFATSGDRDQLSTPEARAYLNVTCQC